MNKMAEMARMVHGITVDLMSKDYLLSDAMKEVKKILALEEFITDSEKNMIELMVNSIYRWKDGFLKMQDRSLSYVERERANCLHILMQGYINVVLQDGEKIDEYLEFKKLFNEYALKNLKFISELVDEGTPEALEALEVALEERESDEIMMFSKCNTKLLGIEAFDLASVYEKEKADLI